MLRTVLILTALFIAGNNTASAGGSMVNTGNSLEDYRMVYRASYNGMPIEAVRELSRTGGEYRIQSVANNFFGKITETETFRINGNGQLQPLSYRYNRSVFGVKRKESLDVDHKAGVARYERKDRSGEIPLDGHYLGPVSYQEQMRLDFLNQREDLSYDIIVRGSVQNYEFEVLGEERLATSAGNYNAVKLSRVRSDDSTRETYIWLAPALNYRLVKLVQVEEDGETYQLELVHAGP